MARPPTLEYAAVLFSFPSLHVSSLLGVLLCRLFVFLVRCFRWFRCSFSCGKGRLAGSRLARNELARECARDDRRRLETSGRWSPLYPRSSRQRESLLGYARAPSLASVHHCSQCIYFSSLSRFVQYGMSLHTRRILVGVASQFTFGSSDGYPNKQ